MGGWRGVGRRKEGSSLHSHYTLRSHSLPQTHSVVFEVCDCHSFLPAPLPLATTIVVVTHFGSRSQPPWLCEVCGAGAAVPRAGPLFCGQRPGCAQPRLCLNPIGRPNPNPSLIHEAPFGHLLHTRPFAPNESGRRTGHKGENPEEFLLHEVEEALPAEDGKTLKIRVVPLLGGELANLPVANMNVFLLIKRTSPCRHQGIRFESYQYLLNWQGTFPCKKIK